MKPFFIGDEDIQLRAVLERPEGIDYGPLCIVLHGLTGNLGEAHIRAASRAMRSCGVATLRVELYGHGRSGGSFEDHDLGKWIHNVETVTDYAASLDFVTDLYLCGHSQGGLTAILAAGKHPERYKALLPLAPALNIPDGARHGELWGVRFDPVRLPEQIPLHARVVGRDYIETAQAADVDGAIAAYKGPVLLVHGDADTSVPLRYSVRAAEQYENAKLIIIPGADHGYHGHLEELTAAIQSFLK